MTATACAALAHAPDKTVATAAAHEDTTAIKAGAQGTMNIIMEDSTYFYVRPQAPRV